MFLEKPAVVLQFIILKSQRSLYGAKRNTGNNVARMERSEMRGIM